MAPAVAAKTTTKTVMLAVALLCRNGEYVKEKNWWEDSGVLCDCAF